MMCQDPKIQEKIDRIMEDLLDSTNITKDGAYNFAFLCWQNGYDKIKNNNGWISVNDRLPEVDKEVLFYTAYNLMYIGHYVDGYREVFTEDVIIEPRYVTHWQPLPEPPKGD